MMQNKEKSGRGAQLNPNNRFFKTEYLREHEEGIDLPPDEEKRITEFLEVHPKTIINKVESPDVGMDFSLNPYQGCEHGCVYCYARNSHEYWGYSAGTDFEQKVLIKKNAPELLLQKLNHSKYKPGIISLSGNTDCYQPIERKLGITRRLLEIFLEYKHPVGIITKNALIRRDLDILKELAALNLVRVALSITTLNEDLRRRMEPRTASIKQRLETLEVLSTEGIPVSVMMAPIIPGLNSHEILPLVEEVARRGASDVGYTMVRLNGAIGSIFEDWLRRTFPDRADKVLNQISSAHGGSLNDSRFGTRMKGEGDYAAMVKRTMEIAKNHFLPQRVKHELELGLFRRKDPGGQMNLFE